MGSALIADAGGSIYGALVGHADAAGLDRADPDRAACDDPFRPDLAGAEVELVASASVSAASGRPGGTAWTTTTSSRLSPGSRLLTVNALTAADACLVPIQCEYYALEGLSQLLSTIDLVRDNLNPSCAWRECC